MAQTLAVSLNELLTAALAVYLARVTGQARLVLTMPFLNRTRETLHTPGHFVNLLPLPLALDLDLPVGTRIRTFVENMREAYAHGRFPYDELVRQTGLDPQHAEVSVNCLLVRRGLRLDGAPIPMHWLSGPEFGLSFLFTQFGIELHLSWSCGSMRPVSRPRQSSVTATAWLAFWPGSQRPSTNRSMSSPCWMRPNAARWWRYSTLPRWTIRATRRSWICSPSKQRRCRTIPP
jgi:non-ribosomal peptide synthetase component F